jgi:flagellar hook protein FlgE
MSLTSSLFSGISGLSTLGNSLQIIGDNIANVNTIGFKASTFTFQDRLSQATATQSGTSQIGRGTALSDITSSFEQGSFESTGNTTDLAIGGDGFFVVQEAAGESLFYTRAGNFRFNKEGYLVNPEGYQVQGWSLDANGDDEGSVGDILLSSFTSPPSASTKVTMITNLDADATNNTTGSNDALAAAWTGSASPPLGSTTYAYQTTVKVYDTLGSTHDITIYYDAGEAANEWEYIVTMNPAEDARSGASGVGAGMLAKGVLTFSASSGTLTDVTMERFTGSDWASTDAGGVNRWDAQTTASDLSTNGYFEFNAQFITGVDSTIEFDVGSNYDGSAWSNSALTTTQFSKASTTTYQAGNGYGAGDLQNVDVDVDGVMTGVYSNGELLYLNRVALAKFIDYQGLHKQGGNLYRETRESGEAITNHPGTNGLGSISPNSLEQSNVDIAAEFVKMITSQRGFQANSKIITTVDNMLQEVIQMKR